MAEQEISVKFNISPILKPYVDELYLDSASKKVPARKKSLENLISPVEGWLITAQSLLAWEKPSHSLILLLSVNIGFW